MSERAGSRSRSRSSLSSGLVSVAARERASDTSPEGVSAKVGNCVCRSCCSLASSTLLAVSGTASTRMRLLLRRGTLKSLGISRSSRGGARSIAAKRDWSHRTKVSILWQERRNWSASARTRITYRFLFAVSVSLFRPGMERT